MYLGAIGNDAVLGVATVGTSVYLTGSTSSSTTVTSQAIGYSTPEAFVALLDTSTTPPKFKWNYILSGEGVDELSSITLDPAGNLFMVGTLTPGPHSGVPTTNSFHGGASDAVALKLSPAGEPVWMTYVGSPAEDRGHAVALAANGELVVAGSLESSGNGKDALVARLNSAGMEQERRVLGGSKEDIAMSVATDADGNLYVGGVMGTASLPMRGGFDSMFAGLSEGFVTLIPAKGGPGWTSFIGGGAEDEVRALSISSENRLVLAGMTQSNSALPGSGGHDMTFGGEYDGFIVAVDPDTTPPAAGRVYDRPQSDELHEDLSQQASLTSISANWEGFSDSESGVVEYEWAIGSEASPESTKPFAPVGAATSATALDLPLEGGTSYFVTVRAINGAGLIATARSNGVKVTAPAEEEARYPVGWSCATTVDASLPMLLSVLALALWGRRRGVPARTFRGQ